MRYYTNTPTLAGLGDGTLSTIATLGWWCLLVWVGYQIGKK